MTLIFRKQTRGARRVFSILKKGREKRWGRDFFGKKRERGKSFRKEKGTKTFFYGTKNPLNHGRVFCKFRLVSNIKFTDVKFVTPVLS